MFKDNKYTRWYYDIINNRKQNSFNGYTEKHHIIPKSMGGSNRKDNIVALTAREHFICHWLLTKMTDSKGMRLALLTMTRQSKNQNRYKITGRKFQIIREGASLATSGKNNPMFGKTRDKEVREKISAKVRDHLSKNGPYQHTEETKKKIAQSRLGKKHSDETRNRWSEIRKGRPGQDNNSGKHWFNNGTRSILSKECPEGFIPGRLPHHADSLS
jgi:hypothetical protein